MTQFIIFGNKQKHTSYIILHNYKDLKAELETLGDLIDLSCISKIRTLGGN